MSFLCGENLNLLVVVVVVVVVVNFRVSVRFWVSIGMYPMLKKGHAGAFCASCPIGQWGALCIDGMGLWVAVCGGGWGGGGGGGTCAAHPGAPSGGGLVRLTLLLRGDGSYGPGCSLLLLLLLLLLLCSCSPFSGYEAPMYVRRDARRCS